MMRAGSGGYSPPPPANNNVATSSEETKSTSASEGKEESKSANDSNTNSSSSTSGSADSSKSNVINFDDKPAADTASDNSKNTPVNFDDKQTPEKSSSPTPSPLSSLFIPPTQPRTNPFTSQTDDSVPRQATRPSAPERPSFTPFDLSGGLEAIQEQPRGTAFDMETSEERVDHAQSRMDAYAARVEAILNKTTNSSMPTNAAQFDQSITGPSRRTNEEIQQNIDFARENTTSEIQASGPYSPVFFSTRVAAEDAPLVPSSLDNVDIPDYMLIESTYTPGENGSVMSVEGSARNKTSDSLPYAPGQTLPHASDAYNAQTYMASEMYPHESTGTTPRLPDTIERQQVTGSDAVVIINDIFNRHIVNDSSQLDEDSGTLTLRMNRDTEDAQALQETQDLLTILNNTVNGKSTVNWVRDFNNMNSTQHSIDSVEVQMGKPHVYTQDLDTPDLKFNVSNTGSAPTQTDQGGLPPIGEDSSHFDSRFNLDVLPPLIEESSEHSSVADAASPPGSPTPANPTDQVGTVPPPGALDTGPIVQQPSDNINPDPVANQDAQQAETNQQNAVMQSIASVLSFCLNLFGSSNVADNSNSSTH